MCPTIEEYQTISVISSIWKIPVKYLVNNPEVKGNGMVLNMSDYVRLEEVQYMLVKKELTMMENRDLNEGFVSAELQYQVIERYLTRTKIIMNTAVIRGKGVPEFMDHG